MARAGARLALVVLLATVTIAARQPPSPAAPASGQISGVVKSAADDTPIARARVVAQAANAEPHVTITGTDGKYVLSHLPAGSYTITVTRTGFVPKRHGENRQTAAAQLDLALAGRVTGIDVALEPGRHISGRILDEDGTPFAGAIVEASVTRFQDGRDVLVAIASTRTDDRGEFRIHGLPPGEYFVSAADPAFGSVATPAGVVRYSPTFHPGVVAAGQARPVTVTESGPGATVEFRLQLVPPARVSGQLVPFNARELLSAAILMTPIDGEGAPSQTPEDPAVLPNGQFSFGPVAPGRYQIRARGQTDPAGAALFAVFAIDVLGADIEGIRLPLRPGAVVDGTLAVEPRKGTKPPRPTALRVRMPAIDGSSFGDALTGTVQADGAFTLRGVMKGAHQIAVDGLLPPWAVTEVLYRGTNVIDRVIEVDEQEHLRGVRIIVTDLWSTISGVVQNARNQPVAHAGVLVYSPVPLHWMRTSRRMRVAYTDERGRFSIGGMPAGEYLAVASMSIDEGDLDRRDHLNAMRARATPVRLDSDDSQASVTLQLAAAMDPSRSGR
jgi:hypothetical protein